MIEANNVDEIKVVFELETEPLERAVEELGCGSEVEDSGDVLAVLGLGVRLVW